MSSSPEVESLKALVATLQSQLQRSRERIRALEERAPVPAAPQSGEFESLAESLALAQMQHVSATSEARRLQGEVSQLRGSYALLYARLQEREREIDSLSGRIHGGAAAACDGDAAAAAAAWEGKAQRLAERLKRCKVRPSHASFRCMTRLTTCCIRPRETA